MSGHVLKFGMTGAIYGASIGLAMGLMRGLMRLRGGGNDSETVSSIFPVPSEHIQSNSDLYDALEELLAFRTIKNATLIDEAFTNVERLMNLNSIVLNPDEVPKASWPKTAHVYFNQYVENMRVIQKMLQKKEDVAKFDEIVAKANKECNDTMHNIMMHTSQRIYDKPFTKSFPPTTVKRPVS